METIDIKKINGINNLYLGFGAYSCVRECSFEGSRYAFKILNNNHQVRSLHLNEKFDYLNELSLRQSVVPKFFVSNGRRVIGYLLPKITFKKIHDTDDNETKFKILIGTYNAIQELHEFGVIHSDIHSGNVLLSGDLVSLIDFDNCTVPNIITKRKYCNFDAKKYIKKYGLNENLDIFLLNILTFKSFVPCRVGEELAISLKEACYWVDDEDFSRIAGSLLLTDEKYRPEVLVDVLRENKSVRDRLYSLKNF